MKKQWWHDAVVYEIYLKSFYDSNGDGIGDLPGVIEKLPVLRDLGVNCLWFTPIYTSPQVDNGYDVADFWDIDPAYGTLADFKKMLDLAHGMGIRVIMDMVLNHTSDEHPWFRESRKSKDNPYRDFYIWKAPGANGAEPNNWGSYFREGNGSAWEFDETTGEYYFHQYAVKMPDLNWEYEPMRKAVYDMLRFWADLGVDGFRLDVFTRFKKTPGFPDTKKEPEPLYDRNGFVVDRDMCTNVEGIHDFLKEMHDAVFAPKNVMTVGEGAGVTSDLAADYVSESRGELDMVYHFELANRALYEMTAPHFRNVQTRWADVIDQNGWAVQYMSNHDSARQVSCYGDDAQYRKASAKTLAALIHTTPGTPFIYQGEEIGMTNIRFDKIEDYNCCYTVGDYYSMVESGVSPEEALDILAPRSRDNARSPYQWDGTANAGFTGGTPWLKVNPRYTEINLAADRKDPQSIFAYYQKLIAMRREHPAIVDGTLTFLLPDHPQLVVYLRKCARETLLIIANLSGDTVHCEMPDTVTARKWERELSNLPDTDPILSKGRDILPWETEIYSLAR